MRLPTRLLTAAIFAVSFLHAAPRPNVLFMMADDLNNRLGCHGHPLCGPIWNSVPTDLYPNSTGILTNSQLFHRSAPNHVSFP